MDVKFFHNIPKEIKFYLVFFCLILVISCGMWDKVYIDQVDYENEKAVSVTFSTEMDVENIRVFIGEESQTSVIGVIVSLKEKHNFTPVVPFTPGQTYSIRKKNTEVLATFTIPELERSEAVELIAMYPRLDTVPANLLKMYFEFAQPMQEVGNALDFIRVTNETDSVDTQPFLRLESELWNKERTLLTLWLDPGRIKTDLIPNREKGLPLTSGKTYRITIDSNWKSREGIPLEKKYTKIIVVGPRDDAKPDINSWKVMLKNAVVGKKLHIDFGEPMDAFLSKETMRVYDANAAEVMGEFKLESNGSSLVFIPLKGFETGNYEISIQSKLEDLAGNNLNHLFDTDLKKNPNQRTPKAVFSIPFEVH